MPFFSEDFMVLWFLAAIRASGVLLIAPVFSSKTVPATVRVMIALFIALIIALLQHGTHALPKTLGHLVVTLVVEGFIGLLMGWATRLVLHSVEIASHVISGELGFTMGQQIDPMSDTSESAVGQLLMSFGSLLFLVSGAHQAVLSAFLRSYEIAPIGVFRGNDSAGTLLVQSTGKIFLLGLQMAAPLVAVNFIISLSFSILGKAAPTLNVFGESFAVRIVVGLTLLGLTLTLSSQLILQTLNKSAELMLQFIP
ncbi:MAG: flagellar biosynthetic protein FliR [Verrucomicrobiota bacterium]